MLALVLATLLAAVLPGDASPSAPAPASSATLPATAPAESGGGLMTRRLPYGAPHVEPGDAVIRDSGSTNVAGYTVVVHPDFSADVYGNGAAEHKTVGSPQAKWLFAKLQAAMPFATLGAGRCMKSASFGSTLTIAYRGEATPDLSCVGSGAARELGRTAAVIVNQLGISPAAGRLRLRLL